MKRPNAKQDNEKPVRQACAHFGASDSGSGAVLCGRSDGPAGGQLSGLNRNTVNRIYRAPRERIQVACEAQLPLFGVVEVDESWFGARNIRGKRGRGAYGKTIVFGIFERAGQFYTEIVPDCSRATLQGIIRGRVDVSSVINSDGRRSYNGLVDLGYGHFRVDHGNDEFVKGVVHINGIEGFWGLAKVRLAKFKGGPDTPSISISRRPNGATTTGTQTGIKLSNQWPFLGQPLI